MRPTKRVFRIKSQDMARMRVVMQSKSQMHKKNPFVCGMEFVSASGCLCRCTFVNYTRRWVRHVHVNGVWSEHEGAEQKHI